MLESRFKRNFKDKLEQIYEGCVLIDIDPTFNRSFPDTFFFYGKFWGAFEFKRESNSSRQPNQPYWVKLLDNLSFARFVEPENEEEVLRDLEYHIQNR